MKMLSVVFAVVIAGCVGSEDGVSSKTAAVEGDGSGAGDCYGEVFVACFEMCVADGDDEAYCPEGCRLRASILCGDPDDRGDEPCDEEDPRGDDAPRGDDEDPRDDEGPRDERP